MTSIWATKKLSDEDLPAIEAEMAKIVKENLPIKPFVLNREDAVKLMEERGEIYKVEASATCRETRCSASTSRANTSTCASART